MSSTSNPSGYVNQLPTPFEMPRDYEDFREIGALHFNRITNAVNRKEGALYDIPETGNFQLYFTPNVPFSYRSVFRTVVNFGALPNAGTKSVAHNIQGIDPGGGNPSTFSFTHIYATSSNQTAGTEQFIPIPYVDTGAILGSNVGIYVDQINVNITTTANLSAFTITYVVLEYLKN